ncbi:hypothetical protein [Massilia sp. GCM10023247]|uniref:hypothetical protein n=1 Tax=Massilia sp. GCM10023247 TaxID=3252643 RepID=UPI0036196CAE
MENSEIFELLRAIRYEEVQLKNLRLQQLMRRNKIENMRRKLDSLLFETQGS